MKNRAIAKKDLTKSLKLLGNIVDNTINSLETVEHLDDVFSVINNVNKIALKIETQIQKADGFSKSNFTDFISNISNIKKAQKILENLVKNFDKVLSNLTEIKEFKSLSVKDEHLKDLIKAKKSEKTKNKENNDEEKPSKKDKIKSKKVKEEEKPSKSKKVKEEEKPSKSKKVKEEEKPSKKDKSKKVKEDIDDCSPFRPRRKK